MKLVFLLFWSKFVGREHYLPQSTTASHIRACVWRQSPGPGIMATYVDILKSEFPEIDTELFDYITGRRSTSLTLWTREEGCCPARLGGVTPRWPDHMSAGKKPLLATELMLNNRAEWTYTGGTDTGYRSLSDSAEVNQNPDDEEKSGWFEWGRYQNLTNQRIMWHRPRGMEEAEALPDWMSYWLTDRLFDSHSGWLIGIFTDSV